MQTYVQHLLKQNADAVVSQLIQERGHFYVCGDISMAAAVGRTLQVSSNMYQPHLVMRRPIVTPLLCVCMYVQNIFEENAAMSTNEAQQYIQSMKVSGS